MEICAREPLEAETGQGVKKVLSNWVHAYIHIPFNIQYIEWREQWPRVINSQFNLPATSYQEREREREREETKK